MPGAGEHRHERLGNHRHVDDDPIALAHAPRLKRSREKRHFVAELAEGELLDGAGHRAVVNHRGLVAAPLIDVPVERVVAGVGHAAVNHR